MNMPDSDRDWLDERLAGGSYIPDNGFTVQVTSRLPKRHSNAVRVLRRRILFLSAFVAFAILVVQIIALLQEANQWEPSVTEGVNAVVTFAHRPHLLYDDRVARYLSAEAARELILLARQPDL